MHLPKSGVEDEDEEEEEEEITTPSSRNGFQRRRTSESKETAESSAKSKEPCLKGSDEVARENSQEAYGSENSQEARKQPRSINKSFGSDNGFSISLRGTQLAGRYLDEGTGVGVKEGPYTCTLRT